MSPEGGLCHRVLLTYWTVAQPGIKRLFGHRKCWWFSSHWEKLLAYSYDFDTFWPQPWWQISFQDSLPLPTMRSDSLKTSGDQLHGTKLSPRGNAYKVTKRQMGDHVGAPHSGLLQQDTWHVVKSVLSRVLVLKIVIKLCDCDLKRKGELFTGTMWSVELASVWYIRGLKATFIH